MCTTLLFHQGAIVVDALLGSFPAHVELLGRLLIDWKHRTIVAGWLEMDTVSTAEIAGVTDCKAHSVNGLSSLVSSS